MEIAASPARRLFTVVIASVCDDKRADLLKRACDSVKAMAGQLDYSIVVVANGARVSQKVLDWLATRSDTRVVRLRSGSYPLARRVGAELADAEFLAFLDDDDEYLPDTLEPKIAYLRAHPDVDVLVTNGLRVNGTTITNLLPPPSARRPDIVEMLMNAGWGACAMTLRMQNVDLSAFDAEFRHLEWTLTTLQLARRHKFALLDQPTYRYYEDTPASLSKNPAHGQAVPEVWRRLSMTYAETQYEDAVKRRYGVECHNVAWQHIQHGRLRDAWRLHAESLRARGGLAFLPFSARLVLASVRGLFV